MSEHLSKETAARLLARQLQPDELLAVSQHLTLCPECRQQLDGAKSLTPLARFLANDLQGSVRAEDLHLNYEQLEGYVDEMLPQAERERVSKHLEMCDSCTQEVKELSFLSKNLSSYPQVTPEVTPAPLRQSENAFRRFPALFGFRSLQFAGLAAVLALAAVIGLLLWQSRKQPLVANGNKDSQTKVPDNSDNKNAPANGPDLAQAEPSKQENSNDDGANGGAAKSAYDALVATAIASQTIAATPALKDLNGRPVTLLGQSDPAQKFDLLSPHGTVVQSVRPTLRWRALAGADSYIVYLLNLNFDVVQNSRPLTGSSWTVARPLDRGQTYIWQVVASKDGKEIAAPAAPAREVRFKVLDSKSAQAIQRYAQDNQDNHLALGIIYAHHGLLDDAERQLSAAATLNQSTELARKFLRDVKAMRR